MQLKKNLLVRNLFENYSTTPRNPKWENAIMRVGSHRQKNEDLRTEFEKDYARILNCNAYRRLKHKTQVFFATSNDHVCTRMEHVNHVASISHTIAKFLGLNTDLTLAIATGHDVGHSPFGHEGEGILDLLVKKYELAERFWHEGNSLKFVDKIETLPDNMGYEQNLLLTYAVRDGILCHCGEVDENNIKARDEFIDLETIAHPGQFQSYTYEGCVIKIADKMAYLGRDIEDALLYKILSKSQKDELESIIQKIFNNLHLTEINTTNLVHRFTLDLCQNSNPDNGLCLSREYFLIMNLIKQFNYENICRHFKLTPFKKYAHLILETIFETMDSFYQGPETIKPLLENRIFYPELVKYFEEWLIKYSNIDLLTKKKFKFANKTIYDINSQKEYRTCVIDFISGMSDRFAIKIFNEIITF